MYILKKDLNPGCVVWANRNVCYDASVTSLSSKRGMFVITNINKDYFLGCRITSNPLFMQQTILKKELYPIKHDSRILECLYKIPYDDIVSSKSFKISKGTFNHFKRGLYQRIVIDSIESPEEYNDEFVRSYLKMNIPKPNNIIVYPSSDKKFKYYYICEEDKDNYIVLSLDKTKDYNYSLDNSEISIMPKNIRFYDYFNNHPLERETVNKVLMKLK